MASLEAQALPYKLIYKYPGMRPKDEVIWDRFVQQRPGAFDAVYYNVPVGDPSRNEAELDEMKFNGGYGVSRWRVDVLGVKDGKQYVIEIKPSADTHAVGEVLAYKALLVAEGKILPDAIPLIITDDASMILLQACAPLGVAVQQI